MGPTLILVASCTGWWGRGDVGLMGLSRASRRGTGLCRADPFLGGQGAGVCSPPLPAPSSLLWLSGLGISPAPLLR